jgi:DNA-3-methyladenine glycosylase I
VLQILLRVKTQPALSGVLSPRRSMTQLPDSKTRCPWARSDLDIAYHDREWGVPQHNDLVLFEFLILEGAQAGLSWSTILAKREAYRRAFSEFDPEKVALYGPKEVRELLANAGIVRNRLKVAAAIANAKAFLQVRKEWGSFDAYVWQFVGERPISKPRKSMTQVPASTRESERMSKELLGRGFKFVGPTICYAFMQAVGMVNDHLVSCFRRAEIDRRIAARAVPFG